MRVLVGRRLIGVGGLVAGLVSLGGPACSSASGGSGGGFNAGGSSGSGGSGGSLIFDGGGGSGGSGVPQTCEQAIQKQSYIGCEYWPTVTSNGELFSGFSFAIAVANPTGSEAVVSVDRGGQPVGTPVSVPPGQLQIIQLPWVQQLKQDFGNDGTSLQSALVRGGAYHVTSSVPITLYQFNPLDFQLTPAPAGGCPNSPAGRCFSFSNDASLLLPTTALRGEYYAMSWPTYHYGVSNLVSQVWVNSPGFIAVTATQDGTNVDITASGHVRGGPGVQPMTPGQTVSYQLNAGDVLMLDSGNPPNGPTTLPGKPCGQQQNGATTFTLCPTPPEYDLTGTHINASKPVSVLGGHDCTFIPFSRFACDHLEESLFPVEALGQDLIVTAPHSVAGITGNPGAPDNMFVRVMSATNDNLITFDPPVNQPVTLQAGQWIEIGPLTQDFRVLGKNKLMVAQFMVGENFGGTSAGAGDPSQSIAIPTEQYRVEYTFLAPASYTHNFVNVVAPIGSTITIDGQAIPAGEFQPIGGSGLAVARHKIPGGPHNMKGNQNFGIVVYGYGSYTSYMYPGGLNLETIVITPE